MSEDKFLVNLLASHHILNYVSAGLQGRYAFLNLLQKYKAIKESTVLQRQEKLQGYIDTIKELRKELLDGKLLVIEDPPQVVDNRGKKLIKLSKELKKFYLRLSETLTNKAGKVTDSKTALKLSPYFLAVLALAAYSHENFVKENIAFFKGLELKDFIKEEEFELKQAEEEVEFVHLLIEGYEEHLEEPSEGLLLGIYLEILPMIGVLRSYSWDIDLLLEPYTGKLTYEDIPPVDEKTKEGWVAAGVPVQQAGYWCSFYFSYEDMKKWANAGITHYMLAGRWAALGFTPAEAREWLTEGFVPSIAFLWKIEDFSPKEAGQYVDDGYIAPSALPESILEEKKLKEELKNK
ncbi:MAG: hypothetical protein D6780_07615 [Candidatus Dadabacteria bacterium]|nr:MAG: hypothetical protein D6780_07615 [Candidatus Dadabacteria bacterium]